MQESNGHHFNPKLDPILSFERELELAKKAGLKDFNAMSLATASKSGAPSLRTVLYKGMVRGGFSFYTNYQSQKSREIAENQQVSGLFFWPTLERQIRLSGQAAKLTRAESEAYFATRERLSQLGAWASSQSAKLEKYDDLAKNLAKFETQFKGQAIPCPPHWGGFAIVPSEIEFWFGQQGRLHIRHCFTRLEADSDWAHSLKNP